MNSLATVILAIDTSCDETAAAITCGLEVWSNVVASQVELHRPYGGVFPTVAKQAHRENIDRVIGLAVKRAGLTWADVDEIRVTIGPGLAPALEVGIEKARILGEKFSIPVAAANHLEGHLWSVWAIREQRRMENEKKVGEKKLVKKRKNRLNMKERRARAWRRSRSHLTKLQLPALGLIVSGGNTLFVLIERRQKEKSINRWHLSSPSQIHNSSHTTAASRLDRQPRLKITDAYHPLFQYTVIGQTLDDAAGEALDKIGRMINLGYPAGPIVEKLAKSGNPSFFTWPKPMTERKDFDLSFAGIKTHARRLTETKWQVKPADAGEIAHFSAGLQDAIFQHIIYKLNKYLQNKTTDNNRGENRRELPIRQLWLGGGVARNLALRSLLRRLARQHHLQFLTPFAGSLCTDNAAMVGISF